MARAGKVSAEFDDLMQHASELLDVMDDELSDVKREEHPDPVRSGANPAR